MNQERAHHIASKFEWKHSQDATNFVKWATNPRYTRYHVRAAISWRPSLYGAVAPGLCVAAIGITQLNTSKWAHFRYPTKGLVLDKAPVV